MKLNQSIDRRRLYAFRQMGSCHNLRFLNRWMAENVGVRSIPKCSKKLFTLVHWVSLYITPMCIFIHVTPEKLSWGWQPEFRSKDQFSDTTLWLNHEPGMCRVGMRKKSFQSISCFDAIKDSIIKKRLNFQIDVESFYYRKGSFRQNKK